MDAYQIILAPIVTEKAFGVKAQRKYVFRVHPDATKIDIRSAVTKLFKVKVQAVNTVKIKGKRRAVGNKSGRTASYKKAYVTLLPDQKIEELES